MVLSRGGAADPKDAVGALDGFRLGPTIPRRVRGEASHHHRNRLRPELAHVSAHLVEVDAVGARVEEAGHAAGVAIWYKNASTTTGAIGSVQMSPVTITVPPGLSRLALSWER